MKSKLGIVSVHKRGVHTRIQTNEPSSPQQRIYNNIDYYYYYYMEHGALADPANEKIVLYVFIYEY